MTATMGAAKAGVTLVTFAEKEDESSFSNVLKESGAKGLLISPQTLVNENDARLSIV